MQRETSQFDARIRTYEPRFREAYKSLNVEWIAKYFKIEKKDLEQLDNPEDCLRDGGQIFFVVKGGEAVATCALYKMDGEVFELAKMAVRPDCQGHGFGDVMMVAAEEWARGKGAREILLLSNTVLNPAISLYKKHGYETTFLGPHPDYERCNIQMRKKLA